MFLGINMFLALLRAHFMSRAKNIFMPANVNSIVIFHSSSLEAGILIGPNRTCRDKLSIFNFVFNN